MYAPHINHSDSPPEVPNGYAGNAFSQEVPNDVPPQNQTEESAIPVGGKPHHRPPRHSHGGLPPWLNLFSKGGFPHFDIRSFFSGDLLLIAVALLLVTGDKNDDCEEEDNDLWLLLLLLYFMK